MLGIALARIGLVQTVALLGASAHDRRAADGGDIVVNAPLAMPDDPATSNLLLTKDAATVERQAVEALAQADYEMVVVGAGLRTLPPMAGQFERPMNARLAFNSEPDGSDKAALRWL